MSAFTSPVIIADDGKSSSLERIPLNGDGENSFVKRWLQQALFNNPQCLSVRRDTGNGDS